MRKILIEYDTIPLGKSGCLVCVEDKIADLLEDYYLMYSVVIKIEQKTKEYIKNYVFVPMYQNGILDFQLINRKHLDNLPRSVTKGIAEVYKLSTKQNNYRRE